VFFFFFLSYQYGAISNDLELATQNYSKHFGFAFLVFGTGEDMDDFNFAIVSRCHKRICMRDSRDGERREPQVWLNNSKWVFTYYF